MTGDGTDPIQSLTAGDNWPETILLDDRMIKDTTHGGILNDKRTLNLI